MEMFEQLRGRTIEKIFIDAEGWKLLFQTEDGNFVFETRNDCCNSVWFAHMTLPHRLDGAFVMQVESKDWRDITPTNEYEVLEAAFWTLITSNGYIDIEVRNSHNGYYGGSVVFDEDNQSFDFDNAREITEDF